MKHLLLIVLISVFSLNSYSQTSKKITPEVTTYYLIRHAEKDRSNPSESNPHLQASGLKRANHWSEILGAVKFDAIYSTVYVRTKETAQPTADKNKLAITIYDADKIDIPQFKKSTKGKTVLIVGHSNTIPGFVNALIGKNTYKDIDDANNGNLYSVTIIDGHTADQVLTIN